MVILFGGQSAEHEVSVQSARNVIGAINKRKYEVFVVGITKSGQWKLLNSPTITDNIRTADEVRAASTVALLPSGDEKLWLINEREKKKYFDLVFPVLHGPLGEDGTVQGLLKLMDVPFVGADVLGSAIGMDKDVAKRLLREAGVPIADFLTCQKHKARGLKYSKVKKKLGLPMFIKPANLGSSVGVSKVSSEKEFSLALKSAFAYDKKILIEKFIKGREIECAVLGNSKPRASIPGEIVVHDSFYSYQAKYLDDHGATLVIPAPLNKKLISKIRRLAITVFTTLDCEGMARVDFFLTPEGKLVVNEINTIPGFTTISMYPKLWEQSGVPYAKLIDILIQLAQRRFADNKKRKSVLTNTKRR